MSTNTNTTTTKRIMTPEERIIIRRYNKAFDRILLLFGAALIATVVVTAVVTSSIVSRPILVQCDEDVICVEENDTLWGYAQTHCPDNMDIRKYIKLVVEYNDKDDATLYVGECIRLPIFEINKY